MSKIPEPTTAEMFGARLKEARRRKHRFANRMADAIGVEHETYRTWERGEREPNLDALNKIAAELNVSLDYLVSGALPAFGQGRRAG